MVEKSHSRNVYPKDKLDRKTPLQVFRYEREVAADFPRLWAGWQKEIAKKYERFAEKNAIKDLFAVAKKHNRKDIPQSMIAVALLDYADSVHNADLSTSNFDVFLQSQIAEFEKVKKLQKEFEAHKGDVDFGDYKKYVTKANKKQPVTIKEIREAKWYTVDWFLFSQYLEKSFATSTNKEVILWKLSQESQVAFVEYTQSNSRLAAIVQLPPDFVKTVQWGQTPKENIEKSLWNDIEKKSFSEVDAVFARDLTREDGPKKILEKVDSSVFGETRLSDSDVAMFRDILKDLALDRWAFFLAQYPDTTPPAWINAEVMKQYVDTGSIPKNLSKEAVEECFRKIVMAYFVENTKKRMQEMVMKEYFSQVAGLLSVQWNHVHLLEGQPITYETSGVITMQYQTTTGIQGKIIIGADGILHVETPFGYDAQQWMKFNIQRTQKAIDGSLVSMLTMMQRGAKNKKSFFEQRKAHLENTPAWTNQSDEKIIDDSKNPIIMQDMFLPEDETALKNIEEPLKKELLIVQCVDRLSAFLERTAKIQWVDPTQDVFLRFMEQIKQDTWTNTSLTLSQNPMIEPLFLLREKIIKNSTSEAESTLQSLEKFYEIYMNNAFKKEDYPFVLDGMLNSKKDNTTNTSTGIEGSSIQGGSLNRTDFAGKKTVWSFLSYFCVGKTSVMQFDQKLLEKTISFLAQNKNDVQMLCELQPTKLSVPLNSLYYANNPDLAQETWNVLTQTKNSLASLQSEVLDPKRLIG